MEGFGGEMREIWKSEGEKWRWRLKTGIRVLSGEDEMKMRRNGLTQERVAFARIRSNRHPNEHDDGFAFRLVFSTFQSLFQNSKLTDMFV
ncbi:hypothetical protein E3N88_03989 [Mikania micrantha]|uniref:Uncharacterized protein n=1 Tax=Mikania micrantha TaxID=192012 RepID=A0A5N6PVB8_9ASTR|nr:hypothetical protein E3N88_03989 [Mikania micrantha]